MLYYYNTLSSREKAFYEGVYQGLCNYQESIVVDAKVNNTRAGEIIEYVLFDHPELSFVDSTSFSIGTQGLTRMVIQFRFLSPATCVYGEHMRFLDECEFIVNHLIGTSTREFEKITLLYEFICRNIKYGYFTQSNEGAAYSQSAAGTLFKKTGVCLGISLLYKCLLDAVGVESIVIRGDVNCNGSMESHAWNLVKSQGSFVHVDVTFGVREYEQTQFVSFAHLGHSDNEKHRECQWLREDILPKCNNTMGGYCEMNGAAVGTENELKAYMTKRARSTEPITIKVPLGSELSWQKPEDIIEKAIQYHSMASRWNKEYAYIMYAESSRYVLRCV